MAYLPQQAPAAAPKKPEQIVLHSSFLQSATYDSANFALTLDFKNRSSLIHRYVFPITWEQFKLAPSHGSFYSRNIKGKYPVIPFHTPLKVSDLTKAKKGAHHAAGAAQAS
jgi:hypothetical protein